MAQKTRTELQISYLSRWSEGNHRSAKTTNKGEYTVIIPEWRKTRKTGISEELFPPAGEVFAHIRKGGKVVANVNLDARNHKKLDISNIRLI